MDVLDVKKAREDFVVLLQGQITEIEQRIDGMKGVIALHNSVVRTSPGLYLVPKGGGYGVASILCGVVMWSPIDAKAQAEYSRGFPGAEKAEAVFFKDALRDELAEAKGLLAKIMEKMEAVAA